MGDDLAAAEEIVVVHPSWWGQPPAILTGWIDRVMRPGIAVVVTSTVGQRDEWLSNAAALVTDAFPSESRT